MKQKQVYFPLSHLKGIIPYLVLLKSLTGKIMTLQKTNNVKDSFYVIERDFFFIILHKYFVMRKHLLLTFLIGLLFLFPGCSTIRYVPVNSTSTVTVKDTVTLKDTLILYSLPQEFVSDLSFLKDTSVVSTSLASSTAYIDTTTMTLRHTITNRTTNLPVKIQYRDHLVYRDSTITKEVPVPVEVIKEVTPSWTYKVLIYSIVLTFLVMFYLYIKLKKRDF